MTGVGTVFSALAFSLRPHMHRRTRAPLFGVDVRPDGEMTFDWKQAEANWTRLSRRMSRRLFRTLIRFCAIYTKSFPGFFWQEHDAKWTRDKTIELVFGGAPLSFGALAIQSAATMNSSPSIQGVASAGRSVAVTSSLTG